MKPLALFLLAFALVFRAAPLCAVSVADFPAVSKSDCADMASEHGKEHDGRPQDGLVTCHTCLSSLGLMAALDFSVIWPALRPDIQSVSILAGATIEPPTPPPRTANSKPISTFGRS